MKMQDGPQEGRQTSKTPTFAGSGGSSGPFGSRDGNHSQMSSPRSRAEARAEARRTGLHLSSAGEGAAHQTAQRHSSLDDEQRGWEEEVLKGRGTARVVEFVYQEDWHALRIFFASVLNTTMYKVFMSLLIAANVTVVILETDFRASLGSAKRGGTAGEQMPGWFKVATVFFLSTYVAEIVVRVYVQQNDYWHNRMNRFDTCIIVLDIISEVLNQVVGDLPSISVLRVLRILRFVRILRQFLVFRELYLMLQGLVTAMRAIIFATLLIFVVLTMWSIVAVELIHEHNVELADEGYYGDCVRCRYAFSSVLRANFTFIKTIIGGDSWGQISLPLMERHPWSACIIMSALVTVQLGLLNLIVAIIVDRAAQARQDDEDLIQTVKQEEFVNSFGRLIGLFNTMDSDRNGSLTVDELLLAYDNDKEFNQIMKLMDISREEMSLVFEIMDKDQSGSVEHREFVEQLHTMRNQDSHTILVFIRHNVALMREWHQEQDEEFKLLQRRLVEHEETFAEIRRLLLRQGPGLRVEESKRAAPLLLAASPGLATWPEGPSPKAPRPEEEKAAQASSSSSTLLSTGRSGANLRHDWLRLIDTVGAEVQKDMDDLQRRISVSLASLSDDIARGLEPATVASSCTAGGRTRPVFVAQPAAALPKPSDGNLPQAPYKMPSLPPPSSAGDYAAGTAFSDPWAPSASAEGAATSRSGAMPQPSPK